MAGGDEIDIHLNGLYQDAGVLDVQSEFCTSCGGPLEIGYGLMGGGMGVYGVCPACEQVIWKCQDAG
jgi:predicted RNA-binding Zn-ribbon protein involved in translation (DUF1610 family)